MTRYLWQRAVVVTLTGAILLIGGCGRDRTSEGTTAPGAERPATVASETVSTPTAPATATSPAEGISDAEADALEDELRAMERELDALSLPGDEDFDDIEDALR